MYFLTSCITIACAFHAPSFHHNRTTVNTPLFKRALLPFASMAHLLQTQPYRRALSGNHMCALRRFQPNLLRLPFSYMLQVSYGSLTCLRTCPRSMEMSDEGNDNEHMLVHITSNRMLMY